MGRLLLALALLVGCHRRGEAPTPPSVYESIPYREGVVGPATKVFLVAGGDDIANFAAEVLEQRRLWMNAGVSEEEIACYYAKPTKRAWADDLDQYRKLAELLRVCFRADPGRLRRDLLSVSAAPPDWIYIYVTGHGLDSQIKGLESSRSRRLRSFVESLSEEESALLDAPAIGLNAGPSPRLGEVTALVRALRKGDAPGDVLFTPDHLRDTLAVFGPQTMKMVVLQACFSGGFIDHHVPGIVPAREGPALTVLPNLVALTATATERPSFGCGSGNDRTYFGGAFNRALKHALDDDTRPPDVDWAAIYEKAAFAVETMESIDAETPSLPGFFTNASP